MGLIGAICSRTVVPCRRVNIMTVSKAGIHASSITEASEGGLKKSIFEKFSRFARVEKKDATLDSLLDAEGNVPEAAVAKDAKDAKPSVDDDDEDFVDMFNPDTGEWNGPRLGEPTRYGDWAHKGRTSDFS